MQKYGIGVLATAKKQPVSLPCMQTIPDINPLEYRYDLPADRIAQYPNAERDTSKLLVMQGDEVTEKIFRELPASLPAGTMLLFNDTRVIRARMLFRKPTGALIEIFFLNPLEPSRDHAIAFGATSGVRWECVIGNAKKWKEGELKLEFLHGGEVVTLSATLIRKGDESSEVQLTWTPGHWPLAAIFEAVGHIPLPPYILRNDEPEDAERYQTVYAHHDGSVAAPTAGLHFTPEVIRELSLSGIRHESITLHVGAGTFRPVSATSIAHHVMHREEIVVTTRLLEALANHQGPVIPVGTTSVRSVESLYWYGLRLLLKGESVSAHFSVNQWEPYSYQPEQLCSAKEVFLNMIEQMQRANLTVLQGDTSLIIVPGYRFAVTNGLITNFHQPGSTLLMLVSALIGERWKVAYDYALNNGFRFLSYGDACLFIPSNP